MRNGVVDERQIATVFVYMRVSQEHLGDPNLRLWVAELHTERDLFLRLLVLLFGVLHVLTALSLFARHACVQMRGTYVFAVSHVSTYVPVIYSTYVTRITYVSHTCHMRIRKVYSIRGTHVDVCGTHAKFRNGTYRKQSRMPWVNRYHADTNNTF